MANTASMSLNPCDRSIGVASSIGVVATVSSASGPTLARTYFVFFLAT